MSVAFRAAGTWSFTANNVATPFTTTPGAPTGKTVGDLLVLVCESRSITATVATPTGWTLVSGFPVRSTTASGGSIYVFTRIADGTATDTPSPVWTGLTTGTTGDSSGAGILCYSGGGTLADGSPTSSDLSAQTTTSVIPATTTAIANSVVIGIAMKILDSTFTSTVATFTERADHSTTSGTGHGIEVSDKITTTPGSSGTATVTWSVTTSARALTVSFGLQQEQPVVTPANIAATSTVGGAVTRKALVKPANIAATSTVSVSSGGGATISKFFLHAAATGDTGTLPGLSTPVSPNELSNSAVGTVTNQAIDAVIGASQTSLTPVVVNTADQLFGRWLSNPLAAQTIAAGSWSLNFAAKRGLGNNISVLAYVGVWRPSTGALVGTIFDTNASGDTVAVSLTVENTYSITVAGGGALTVADGDVLIVELYALTISSSITLTFYYDGGTEGSVVDEASTLVAPAALSMFGGSPGFIVIPGGGTKSITPSTNISATSTVGGAITATKLTKPATISATSTTSGKVTATRKIAGNIAATSTISGSVTRLRPITPSTVVSATSTVSGTIHRIAGVQPQTISATSVVSGAIAKLSSTKPITPTSIAATSTVSGSVAKSGLIHPLQVSATSVVSGAVGRLRQILAAGIAATSTVSGKIVAIRAIIMSAQIHAPSVVSGLVTALRKISPANILATSTVSGVLIHYRPITPTNIAATSTVAGRVITIHIFRGNVSATSTVTGRVTATHVFKALTISATSTVAGLVRVTRAVKPLTISATSTLSGRVIVTHRIGGNIAATSSVSGTLTRLGTDLITGGNVAATSTVSGRVIVTHRIAGNVAATSIVTGIVHRVAGIKPLTISATSTLTGKIGRIRPLTALSVTATSTVTGKIVMKRVLIGNVFATSTMSGILHKRVPVFPATIHATSTMTGVLHKAINIIPGNINATSTVSGTLIVGIEGLTIYRPTTGSIVNSKTGHIPFAGRTEDIEDGKTGRIKPAERSVTVN